MTDVTIGNETTNTKHSMYDRKTEEARLFCKLGQQFEKWSNSISEAKLLVFKIVILHYLTAST